MQNRLARRAALAFTFLTFGTATAQAPRPIAFSKIEPGRWLLREASDPTENRAVCISDPTQFVQVHHSKLACQRVTVASDADEATVRYTCTAAGYGQTSIRVETPRLIHVDTQGIENGAPFALNFEGRRSGACN